MEEKEPRVEEQSAIVRILYPFKPLSVSAFGVMICFSDFLRSPSRG